MDPNAILKSALGGARISAIEALMLMQAERPVLPEIFYVADELNNTRHQRIVTYIPAVSITVTNICRARCRLCFYPHLRNDERLFTRDIDEVLGLLETAPTFSEVRLSGGFNPQLTLTFLCDLLRELRTNYPLATIRALSPAWVSYLARKSRTRVQRVLDRLQEAGLDILSGRCADILNDKVRKKIAPDKVRTAEWVDISRRAHRMGIRTSAAVLFGHIENEIHICEHLEVIRNLQDQTGGFLEFTPLPAPKPPEGHSKLYRRTEWDDVDEMLRLFAVCRVFFGEDIPNIQFYWQRLGEELALSSLRCGVNDLGSCYLPLNGTSGNGRPSTGAFRDLKTLRRAVGKTNRLLYRRSSDHQIKGGRRGVAILP